MRFLFGFALFAILIGLGVGAFLRSTLGRKFFGRLAVIALLPLVGHAIYLITISWRAGAAPAYLLGYAGATLALVALFAVMARRSIAVRPWLTVFMPALAGLAYVLLVVLMYSFGLNTLSVQPNAIAGAVAAQAIIGFSAALMVFVPLPANERSSPRMPWQRKPQP